MHIQPDVGTSLQFSPRGAASHLDQKVERFDHLGDFKPYGGQKGYHGFARKWPLSKELAKILATRASWPASCTGNCQRWQGAAGNTDAKER